MKTRAIKAPNKEQEAKDNQEQNLLLVVALKEIREMLQKSKNVKVA